VVAGSGAAEEIANMSGKYLETSFVTVS